MKASKKSSKELMPSIRSILVSAIKLSKIEGVSKRTLWKEMKTAWEQVHAEDKTFQ